jgi:hypothetical protein
LWLENSHMAIGFADITAPRALHTIISPATTFVVASAIVLVSVITGIIVATGGGFGFSLDDPYIHLALAERIAEGHYGLNLGEAAAPASSIIYPFLLAPLLALGLGQYAALLLNLCGAGACLALFAALLEASGIIRPATSRTRLSFVAVTLAIGLNIAGLALTGLEHTLHVADTLACLLGIVRTSRGGRTPWWLPVALVLNPLLRFEGLAVCGAGVVVLLQQRRVAASLGTAGAATLLVGGFCLFLHHLGLPMLPSSVLVKSAAARSPGMVQAALGLGGTLAHNLASYGAPQLCTALALLWAGATAKAERQIALFATLPVLAHFLAGAFGWFGRYEIYVLALGWGAVIAVHAPSLAKWLAGPFMPFAALPALWLGMHAGYANVTALTPLAARDIHLQQFQMHRFVTGWWKAPVAVSDLGWVSFGNDAYVLDLGGLGSEAARVGSQQSGGDPAWMEALAQRHGVKLAITYADRFARLPSAWVPVAQLILAGRPVIVRNTVTFYATTPVAIPELREALAKFAPTLPAGVDLQLH